MKYINTYENHSSYDEKLNGGGVDISLPNVSYCKDIKDVHYTPYNLVRFYVGEISGTTPQAVPIFVSEESQPIVIQVSEGNKWYTAIIPSNYHLKMIANSSNIEYIVIKANIKTENNPILNVSRFLKKLSIKGSNTSDCNNMNYMFIGCSKLTSLDLSDFDTSNVTSMDSMFNGCSGLTYLDLSNFKTSKVTTMTSMFYGCKSLASLDLSGWDTSNVINNSSMFHGCGKLREIRMVGCTPETRTKIEGALTSAGIKDNVTIVTE